MTDELTDETTVEPIDEPTEETRFAGSFGRVVLAALGVAAAVFGFWAYIAGRGDGIVRAPDTSTSHRPRTDRDAETAGIVKTTGIDGATLASLPDWALEGTMIAQGSDVPAGSVLPRAYFDIERMCFGHTPDTINSIALKKKLLELRSTLLTDEQKQELADRFRESDNRALKFHLLVVLRTIGDDIFVEPVREYYDIDPASVTQALRWMQLNTPDATAAMESLYRTEIDPRRRADILNQTGLLGLPQSEPMLRRAFESGVDTVDRATALSAMARIQTETSRETLWSVIDGEREEVLVEAGGDLPTSPTMEDLRGHAVVGMLQHGDYADVERLLDRALAKREDDAVAGYVEEFFAVVRDGRYVRKIVEDMLSKGRVSASLLSYLDRAGSAEDRPLVRSLLELDADDETRTRLRSVIDRMTR